MGFGVLISSDIFNDLAPWCFDKFFIIWKRCLQYRYVAACKYSELRNMREMQWNVKKRKILTGVIVPMSPAAEKEYAAIV
jgi:hypothetical protein